MTENRGNQPGSEEELLRRGVRSLGRVHADADFRSRLRADFVSGRITQSAPRRRRATLFSFPTTGFARWAAAAVILLAIFAGVVGTARRTSWEILAVRGTGSVRVQDSTLPVDDAATLGERLAAGGRIETRGEAELDLRGADALALGMAPGTEIQLQRPPARWLGRRTEIRMLAGELRILTGPAFPGARLQVHTPEGLVRLTGTAVAVYRDSTVTCVCVLEGTAAIGVDGAHLDDVPAGKRKVMFADEREPMILDIEPQHRTDLQAFIERSRPRLGDSVP